MSQPGQGDRGHTTPGRRASWWLAGHSTSRSRGCFARGAVPRPTPAACMASDSRASTRCPFAGRPTRRALSRRPVVSDRRDQPFLRGDHASCDRQEIRLVDIWMYFEEACQHANQLPSGVPQPDAVPRRIALGPDLMHEAASIECSGRRRRTGRATGRT